MTDRELMQQALEALERYGGVDQRACDAEEALRERLAQPEQEPFCYHDGRNIVGKEFADHSDVFPLYTCPQAREPLTDEQFNRIPELYVTPPHHVEMVVRAIEAAHGIQEKNA